MSKQSLIKHKFKYINVIIISLQFIIQHNNNSLSRIITMFNIIKNEQHDNKQHVQHEYYEKYINNEHNILMIINTSN